MLIFKLQLANNFQREFLVGNVADFQNIARVKGKLKFLSVSFLFLFLWSLPTEYP